MPYQNAVQVYTAVEVYTAVHCTLVEDWDTGGNLPMQNTRGRTQPPEPWGYSIQFYLFPTTEDLAVKFAIRLRRTTMVVKHEVGS